MAKNKSDAVEASNQYHPVLKKTFIRRVNHLSTIANNAGGAA
jgi:hypothetical protein